MSSLLVCRVKSKPGLADEALELTLSGVNLGAKHSNDHERAPSGMIEVSGLHAACERQPVFTSMATGTPLVTLS
jgi:hypothetical protein